MSAGFDARVEARLIGLRMASDGITATIAGLPSNFSSNRESDRQSTLSDQSVFSQSSTYTSSSSNISFNSNAPITARRFVEFCFSSHVFFYSFRQSSIARLFVVFV